MSTICLLVSSPPPPLPLPKLSASFAKSTRRSVGIAKTPLLPSNPITPLPLLLLSLLLLRPKSIAAALPDLFADAAPQAVPPRPPSAAGGSTGGGSLLDAFFGGSAAPIATSAAAPAFGDFSNGHANANGGGFADFGSFASAPAPAAPAAVADFGAFQSSAPAAPVAASSALSPEKLASLYSLTPAQPTMLAADPGVAASAHHQRSWRLDAWQAGAQLQRAPRSGRHGAAHRRPELRCAGGGNARLRLWRAGGGDARLRCTGRWLRRACGGLWRAGGAAAAPAGFGGYGGAPAGFPARRLWRRAKLWRRCRSGGTQLRRFDAELWRRPALRRCRITVPRRRTAPVWPVVVFRVKAVD
jgi:hypothetical protein